jgi:tricorn protease
LKNTEVIVVKGRYFVVVMCLASIAQAGGGEGYYRHPAIHQNLIVFSAEGDLWRVAAEGGMAQRLTSHASDESNPRISPDGSTLAFTARGARGLYDAAGGGRKTLDLCAEPRPLWVGRPLAS